MLLRAKGSVVDKAKENVFAATDKTEYVYPIQDLDNTFTITVPIREFTNSLEDRVNAPSPAEIAHDGVVIIDAFVVDSSGRN